MSRLLLHAFKMGQQLFSFAFISVILIWTDASTRVLNTRALCFLQHGYEKRGGK